MKQRFDKFGWICVSEDFNVQRLMRETIDLIKGNTRGLENLSALQINISNEIRGKQVFLVLDDVWNENRSQWELFSESLMSAKEAKVLVTTRNEFVAKIMQTVSTFKLDYMSKEHSWVLFKHYVFGEVNQKEDPKFVEIGKKILEKCGKLPLAIKCVASLLRHELEEEKWIDLLESEIWDSDKLCDEVFKPLQISYARLPTILKPCFLYCSMFPKDELLPLDLLVQLWTAQGYIQSTRKRNLKKIGREYVKQLWERSFLEGSKGEEEFHLAKSFKLHDVVHDLARLNSHGKCYSIDASNVPEFPSELYHLYIRNVEILRQLPSIEVTALRTLIISNEWLPDMEPSYFDFSKAHKLRALVLKQFIFADFKWELGSEFFSFIGDFKHLRHLSLGNWPVLSFLHSLCFLRTLIIEGHDMEELPESIGNLVSLEELVIYNCPFLEELPSQMGRLTNIQTIKICNTGVSSLPPSLNKTIVNIQELHVRLKCTTIRWLEDFVDMKGTLIIDNLSCFDSGDDGQCANLARMHSLECLMLLYDSLEKFIDIDESCDEFFSLYTKSIQLQLYMGNDQNLILDDKDEFLLLARLQPHPNLRELHLEKYPGITFPEWMRDNSSCASLEKIVISHCRNLASVSFGNLGKLKYLEIEDCDTLLFLGADSLPSQLQELKVHLCWGLISLPGIKNLVSLVKLSIQVCPNLRTLMDDELPSVQLSLGINESLHQNFLLGLRNLISLRSLKIDGCHELQALVDEPRPVESCEVEISDCPGLWNWCSHHSIPYKRVFFK